MIYSKGPIAYREYIEEKENKVKEIRQKKIEVKCFLESRKASEAKISEKWKKDFEKYAPSWLPITIMLFSILDLAELFS